MNFITRLFTRVKPLPEGTHHKQDVEDEKPYRLHLRLGADGSGVLVVNASTVLHLNPTAAEYAYHFIKGTAPEEAAREVSARYRVDRPTALADFADFADRIRTLITTPDLDPVSFLDFDRASPHSAELTAPLRLDCALTYELPPGSKGGYAPDKRVDRELSTGEWGDILDKAWAAGIPHITLTGGEPTLRADLPDLIARAEQNGQVCGLLTDGLMLSDKGYLDILLQTGLDHVLLVLQPDNPQSWTAIETILPEDLFLTVHFTVTAANVKTAPEVIRRLASMGVRNLSLSTAATGLAAELQELRSLANALNLTLRWDLPVPYSEANPVTLETKPDEVPAGAGHAWMYVEPDGDVLPAQGMAGSVLGNFLRDPWEKIHP
ncbi:MAG TPA: radical SAM protein [Anaerolineales bacterium]